MPQSSPLVRMGIAASAHPAGRNERFAALPSTCLLHHRLTNLANAAQTPLQRPLQQVVAKGREADQHRQHQQGRYHSQQRIGLGQRPVRQLYPQSVRRVGVTGQLAELDIRVPVFALTRGERYRF